MKKLFISAKEDITGTIAKAKLKELEGTIDFTIVENESEAELVLKQVTSENALAYYRRVPENTYLFTATGNGVKVYDRTATKLGSKFIKGTLEESLKVDSPLTPQEDIENTRAIINYLVGKVDTVEIKDVIGQLTWDIFGMLNKSRLLDKDIELLSKTFNITEDEIDELSEIVQAQTRFDSSKLSAITREVNYFHMENKLLPNIGDSLVANLITASMRKNIAKAIANRLQLQQASGDIKGVEESTTKLKEQIARVQEEYNKARKTVRMSLQGSKAFGKYAKEGMENFGIYTLFIPEPTLADDEVMIPEPTFGSKEDRANYPQIGDEIIDARHPITTIMLGLKVVGYTTDGSIRTSAKVCLAYYGDADGDAHSASWGKFQKYLDKSTTDDLDDFCEEAGIEVEDISVPFEVTLEDINNGIYDTDESSLIESGIEQLKAKRMTKGITGMLGATERNATFTLINEDVQVTAQHKYEKSWLSQIGVQAKNILSDLQSGNMSDIVKQTLMLFDTMSADTLTASRTVSQLLDMSQEEAYNFLVELKGIKAKTTYNGSAKVASENDDITNIINSFGGLNF